jgi:hypothetical protein
MVARIARCRRRRPEERGEAPARAGIEAKLDPTEFLRIHRSTFNGDYQVILKDGTKLTMSSSYRQLKTFRRATM